MNDDFSQWLSVRVARDDKLKQVLSILREQLSQWNQFEWATLSDFGLSKVCVRIAKINHFPRESVVANYAETMWQIGSILWQDYLAGHDEVEERKG